MSTVRRLLVCLIVLTFCAPLQSVQSLPGDPQAWTLSQKSSAMLARSIVTDVVILGTARRIAGSEDETGTAPLEAVASGSERMDLSLPSGAWSEVANPPAGLTGSRSGPDGVAHPIAQQNLLVETVWFFPTIPITRRLASQGYVAKYLGQEQRNDQTVEHIAVVQTAPAVWIPISVTFEHLQ
jgi:hypothetical protein